MLIFNILFSFWTVFSGWLHKQNTDKIKELEKSNKKLILDIISLHNNQKMITSSVKELHRMIKKYDKGAKKQIRIDQIEES
jgi:hypothetical protein